MDNATDHALAMRAHDKMVLLAKIIDETKNKHEMGGRVKKMQSMIKHWKNKTNVITAAYNRRYDHNTPKTITYL